MTFVSKKWIVNEQTNKKNEYVDNFLSNFEYTNIDSNELFRKVLVRINDLNFFVEFQITKEIDQEYLENIYGMSVISEEYYFHSKIAQYINNY
ncbi:hypothetical protein [[Mycoplasma] gypis]|uniref:Uncharacterized protein n=1 Tax=[Mycoplasma] gypis TaxID=92404 RepID=A0ABZ2RMP8_9BACT|nr:hypothetical protein [[Mycoplasma] gypis]MBN0919671.1 hypothetical protein [[Mycoplasma] gypis]